MTKVSMLQLKDLFKGSVQWYNDVIGSLLEKILL